MSNFMLLKNILLSAVDLDHSKTAVATDLLCSACLAMSSSSLFI